MKKLLKLKNKKTRKSKIEKRKRNLSKKVISKKHFLQLDSPHNTNEYLMNVKSSPFWNDYEEDSIEIVPSNIININNDINFEKFIIFDRSVEVTKEKTLKENNEKENSIELIQKIEL